MSKIAEGDRIHIKVGDERGSWGIVRKILHGEYHVAIAGAESADRVYDRNEISKPRVTPVTNPETGQEIYPWFDDQGAALDSYGETTEEW